MARQQDSPAMQKLRELYRDGQYSRVSDVILCLDGLDNLNQREVSQKYAFLPMPGPVKFLTGKLFYPPDELPQDTINRLGASGSSVERTLADSSHSSPELTQRVFDCIRELFEDFDEDLRWKAKQAGAVGLVNVQQFRRPAMIQPDEYAGIPIIRVL